MANADPIQALANNLVGSMTRIAEHSTDKAQYDKSFAVTILGVNQKFTGSVSAEDQTTLITKYSIPATIEEGDPNYYTIKIYGAYYVVKQNSDFKLYDKVMVYLPNGDWSALYLDYRNTANVRIPARFYSETEPTEGVQENDYWYEIDESEVLKSLNQYLPNDETGELEWRLLYLITSGSGVGENIGTYNERFNDYSGNTATGGAYAHIEGTENTVTAGLAPSVGGAGNTVGGNRSIVHGEDNTLTGADNCAVVGNHNAVTGDDNVVTGAQNTVAGNHCVVAGICNNVPGGVAHAIVGGRYANISNTGSDKIVIGNGSGSNLSNAFRVTHNGDVYASVYNTSGADYAEFFEWADGNSENDDRRGLLVQLAAPIWDDKFLCYVSDGTIEPANGDDILGAVSARPSLCGNAYEEEWHGKYKRDVFGTYILDKDGERQLSDDYDSSLEYIPRSQRKEWAKVGLTGRLIVCDNGKCTTDQYIMAENGVAIPGTLSLHIPNVKMLRRIDGNHIEILVK